MTQSIKFMFNKKEYTFEIEEGMSRQVFDKINRLRLQRQFAEQDRDIDQLQQIEDNLLNLMLTKLVVSPAITKEELANPKANMLFYSRVMMELNKYYNSDEDRDLDLKKKLNAE